MKLPVEDCLDEIVSAIVADTPVVLKAPPGAGKTTGVPPALLNAGVADSGQIILVQPRRLAARTAASRIAKVVGAKLGEEVGYHVRFDRKAAASTKVIAMTTGILLRRLSSDPLLDDVACVILDEFHERSLEMDLALGMIHRIRQSLRPELKLVVMSATLEPAPIVDFLGDALAVTSEGRSYPVDIRYAPSLSRDWIDRQVADALPQMLGSTSGHVLVFLPGVGEIRRTQAAIAERGLDRDAHVLPLYGDLSPKDQDHVLAESAVRKIILATNVAETSITIPGVTGVIDSGQSRVLRFDPAVGMSALRVEPISQASADQRAGRAGRTESGVCLRLWPANTHRSRREVDTPEISRNDFSSAMLTLAAWGERDPAAFDWLTPPRQDSVQSANALLKSIDAIDAAGGLTDVGTSMLSLPLHPRLARFMVAAAHRGVAAKASLAAALLTERDPFRGFGSSEQAKVHTASDVVDRVERMEAFAEGNFQNIDVGSAKQVQRVAKQLLRTVSKISATTTDKKISANESLMQSLLAAYPDRLAKARQRTPDSKSNSKAVYGVMVGGRGVKLDRRSLVKSSELFLCIDVDAKGTEALVRAASAVDEKWLPGRMIREMDEPFYSATSKAVVARRRRYFVDLLLAESPIECRPSEEVANLLYDATHHDVGRLFPDTDQAIQNFIARVRFICQHVTDADLPDLSDQGIQEILYELCQSRTSVAELKRAPWNDHLRGRYSYEQLQQIDRLAPDSLTLPSGNLARIEYADGKPPVLAARIQELFGWPDTPRIAGGRVPVQLHLLGPNRRPQQITDDLANFWKETYAQVRKDLRRRYSKHYWPEDPTTAKATHNGLKPRS
ncbi:ATP-dependent helicase HrpB [Planctomycetes bacterium K23_9]|uniref:ATP-dependent RNA helicase HrpB n=1 Tax=Stieleria marina TaxID=1930275 RepID=A0A517P3F0_9BACT|nr:ATP-dependent RNA helicase HrpB [Planctomycetes bacterium K23_9]